MEAQDVIVPESDPERVGHPLDDGEPDRETLPLIDPLAQPLTVEVRKAVELPD